MLPRNYSSTVYCIYSFLRMNAVWRSCLWYQDNAADFKIMFIISRSCFWSYKLWFQDHAYDFKIMLMISRSCLWFQNRSRLWFQDHAYDFKTMPRGACTTGAAALVIRGQHGDRKCPKYHYRFQHGGRKCPKYHYRFVYLLFKKSKIFQKNLKKSFNSLALSPINHTVA